MNIIFGSSGTLAEDMINRLANLIGKFCPGYDFKIENRTSHAVIFSKGDGETLIADEGDREIIFDGYAYGYSADNLGSYAVNLSERIEKDEKFMQGNESGVFNCAVHYRSGGNVSIANDSSGLFPFYYTIADETFFYSSHMHFLGKLLNRSLDPVSAIQRIIFNNANLGSRTFYDGINRINPGEIITFNIEKKRIESKSTQEYYTNYTQKEPDTYNRIWNSINHEIKYIVSDRKKIGMMLSEGFDSRFIGGIFEINKADLYTFTHGTMYNGKKTEGIRITEQVAEELGSSHMFHPMENGFPGDFKKVRSQLFLADNLNIVYFSYGSEYFKKLGVDCVTTGYGLDSTLGGFFYLKNKYSRFKAVTQRYSEIFLQNVNMVSDEYVEKLSEGLIAEILKTDENFLKKKIDRLFSKDVGAWLKDNIGNFTKSVEEEFERIKSSGSKLPSQQLQRFSLENVTRRCFFGQDLTLRINNKVVVPSYGRLFMNEVSALHPKYRLLHKAYISIFRKYLKSLTRIKNAGYNLPVSRNRFLLESSRFYSKWKEIKMMNTFNQNKGKVSIENLRAAFNPEVFARRGNLLENFREIIFKNRDIINEEYMIDFLNRIQNYKANASYLNPFYDILEYEVILKN